MVIKMKKEFTAGLFSNEVINHKISKESGDMTLLEALVEVCDKYEVPYEDVCSFKTEREVVSGNLIDKSRKTITIEETIDLITSNLREKLRAECSSRGLLKGRTSSLI